MRDDGPLGGRRPTMRWSHVQWRQRGSLTPWRSDARTASSRSGAWTVGRRV